MLIKLDISSVHSILYYMHVLSFCGYFLAPNSGTNTDYQYGYKTINLQCRIIKRTDKGTADER